MSLFIVLAYWASDKCIPQELTPAQIKNNLQPPRFLVEQDCVASRSTASNLSSSSFIFYKCIKMVRSSGPLTSLASKKPFGVHVTSHPLLLLEGKTAVGKFRLCSGDWNYALGISI
jgi:hypothetical protein